MSAWEYWCAFAIVLVLFEMFTPTLFFINLALGAFCAALFAYFIHSLIYQSLVFALTSIVFLLLVRPFFLAKMNNHSKSTGIEAKYFGATARVVKEVTASSGRIAIYGEEWDARVEDNSVIPVGSQVKILRNESLVMFIEEIKES